MKQIKGIIVLLLLLFAFHSQQTYAQSCSITIETSKSGNININSGISYFTLNVNFGQIISRGTITVSFSQNIDVAFTGPPDITWAPDDKSCKIKYTVGSFTEKYNDVYAEVKAKSTGGQNFSCQSPLFQVDKVKPGFSISFAPPTITPQTTGNFVITVAYNEEMDITKLPKIEFNKNIEATLGAPSTSWSGNSFITSYPIHSSSQQNDQVTVSVTGGLDKAQNEQNLQTKDFRIEMSRIIGLISCLSSPDGGAHVNKQSNTFSIKTTYAGKMLETSIPTINFDKNITATLNETTKTWSDNSTVYTYNYNVNTSSTMDATVTATVAGAVDFAGKPIEESTGTFRVDFKSPICQVLVPDISKSTTTHTVTLTYDEEMSTDAPTLTILPSEADAIFGAHNGSWDATKKIYTAIFPITRTPPGIFTSANITVTGAKDAAGNPQEEANQSFTIDQRDIDVTATMNPSTIQSSTATAVMTLTFNVNMDQSSIPKIVIEDNVQGAIKPKANGSKWLDSKVYTVEYELDKTKKVEIKDIDVTVSEAKNTDGETMAAKKIADVFTINFLAPSCVVTFEPLVVLDGATTFTITLVYDTDMDVLSKPLITFGNFNDYELTFTNERYNWTDKRTCIFIYDIIDKNEQRYVKLTASEAKSTTGNLQAKSDAAETLTVDMLDFVVNANVNSSTINCNSPQLLVTITFNQLMTETAANIVSFANYNPEGFLTFNKLEWTSNSEVVVEYAVHPDVAADNPAVDIKVDPITNFFNREYPGGTFSNKFSAKSTPPIIDFSTTQLQSPLCHDDENGEIHLAVSGGISPLTYTWTKDNEIYTGATGADVTNLGAGNYDVVVKGTDNCLATYSITLSNPEAIILTAEVKHHMEKIMDGEITLSASGGTLPYTYYLDGASQGDKTDYTSLNAGIYNFEVQDANVCKATASAKVMNYQTPTIFTPNGDGHNDVFMEGNKVEIFDRNGSLVFKGENGWDGRYKGQLVRPAVYFYIVTFPDGYQKKGTIQVYKP